MGEDKGAREETFALSENGIVATESSSLREEDSPASGEALLDTEDYLSSSEDARARNRFEWALPLLMALIAGVIFFARLGTPQDEIPLDEAFYVPDARSVRAHGAEAHFVVHPPVAKWFIAAGMSVFGDEALGWRAGSALFGALGVMVAYLLARRLWSSTTLAVIAALLLALDGLWFVQSRVAMLDIYAATFVLTGILLLLEDRARWGPERRGSRWLRLASGVCFGLAIGTKWSSAPFLVMAALVFVVWGAASLREGDRFGVLLTKRSLGAVGTFIVLPMFVYVATYIPWYLSDTRYVPPECESSSGIADEWTCNQQAMFRMHNNARKFEKGLPGKPIHEYVSEAWSWPWIGRPVHHSQATAQPVEEGGVTATRDRPMLLDIVSLPNPLIWLPAFFVAIPLLTWWAIRRRDAIAGVLLAFIAAGYLPFLVAGAQNRPLYMFYMTSVVPLLVLAVVHVLRAIERGRVPGAFGWYYVVACLAIFAYFYPVMAAAPVLEKGGGLGGWKGHMWMSIDCASSGIKHFCWR